MARQPAPRMLCEACRQRLRHYLLAHWNHLPQSRLHLDGLLLLLLLLEREGPLRPLPLHGLVPRLENEQP